MKKEYKNLELETVRFDAEDVITASGDPICPKDSLCRDLLFCPQNEVCRTHGPCDCVAPAFGCGANCKAV